MFSLEQISAFTLEPKLTIGAPKPRKKYSAKELAMLAEARILAADLIREDKYYDKDHFLMRFLKARNFDIKAAVKMGKEARQWRLDNNIDSILTENYEEFVDCFKYQGHDLDGRPIVLLTPMDVDVRVMVNKGKRERMLRAFIQMFETGLQHFKNDSPLMTNGDEVTKVVAIADFDGFGFRKHACPQCFPFYIDMLRTALKYYPHCVKYLIVVNVYSPALPLLNVVQPFMNKSSRKALKLYGKNKAEWSKTLSTIIAPDQLPPRFGGTMKSCD